MTKRITTTMLALAALATAAFTTGCTETPADPGAGGRTVYGDSVAAWGGSARSFVRLDAKEKPLEVGVEISAASLNGLPDDMGDDNGILVGFPTEVLATPYRHIEVDWYPQGHAPEAVYGEPLFNVDFFTVSNAFRGQMTGEGEDAGKMNRIPAPDYRPQRYYPAGNGQRFKGVHWLDSNATEWNGGDFTTTFIHGFYDALPSFAETKVAYDQLIAKATIERPIMQPKKYATPGLYYPTRYSVRYDATRRSYVISLGGMTLR